MLLLPNSDRVLRCFGVQISQYSDKGEMCGLVKRVFFINDKLGLSVGVCPGFQMLEGLV